MNYDEFKQELEEKVLEKLKKEHDDAYVSLLTLHRVNQEVDSLVALINGKTTCPTIYVEQMYEKYNHICELIVQKGTSENPMDVLTDDICEFVIESSKEIMDSFKADNINIENMPNNIVLQLINTEQNKEMLENVPHREFEDLSVIYRWIAEKNEKGMYSTIVRQDMADKAGMKEEELYKCALKNTKRMFPVEIKSMADIITDIMLNDIISSMPEELLEGESIENVREQIMEEERELMNGPYPMYVITNEERCYGAAEILFNENLDKVSEIFHDDLYILPSSIHEGATRFAA